MCRGLQERRPQPTPLYIGVHRACDRHQGSHRLLEESVVPGPPSMTPLCSGSLENEVLLSGLGGGGPGSWVVWDRAENWTTYDSRDQGQAHSCWTWGPHVEVGPELLPQLV